MLHNGALVLPAGPGTPSNAIGSVHGGKPSCWRTGWTWSDSVNLCYCLSLSFCLTLQLWEVELQQLFLTDIHLDTFSFSAFELFLTSLVKQEMSQMPRGVYFSALRGGNLRSDQGKTVAGIPSFMLKTYEKNKQPGLKPGLAGDQIHPLPV